MEHHNNYFEENFDYLEKYHTNDFIYGKNRFTSSNCKLCYEDYLRMKLFSKHRGNFNESNAFLHEKTGDDELTITRAAPSFQYQFINPEVFKAMNYNTLNKIIENDENYGKFKGLIVVGVDGSDFQLPYNKITFEEFNVNTENDDPDKRPQKTTKGSFVADLINEYFIDSIISTADDNEHNLAYQHFKNINENYNIEEMIFIADRGYNAIEIMLTLMYSNSNFIIRLRSNSYKKEQSRMKTDDEIVKLNLNRVRVNKIKNPKIKEIAEHLPYLNVRIINIEINENQTETLITNLSPELANEEEMKYLYHLRWTIETGFDRLKNKVHIEQYSGYKKQIIEQDVYAEVYMYNYTLTFKKIVELTKLDEINERRKLIYKVNINTLIGTVKIDVQKLIQSRNDKRESIKNRLLTLISINLSSSKIEIIESPIIIRKNKHRCTTARQKAF